MALTETLQDNFNDNSIDAAKWNTGGVGGTPVESSQRLNLNTTGAGSYAYLLSVNTYDLTNSYIKAELRSFTGGISQPVLAAYKTNIEVRFILAGDQVLYATWLSSGAFDTSSLAYDANLMRWLRIRDTSGVVYWEYSPDNVSWFTLHVYDYTSFDITNLRVYLESVQGTSGSGTAVFDNFNINNYFTPSIELSQDSTITATPHTTHNPTITIEGTGDVNALGLTLADQSKIDKTYMYKVYDADDNFLGIWNDVISELTFDHEIHSAGSSIQVELARNSDSRAVELEQLFTTSGENITTQDSNNIIVGAETTNSIGPGSNVDVNYRVEVWVFYGEITQLITTSGDLILTQDGEEITLNFGSVNGLRKFNGYITRYISRYGGEETVQVSISSFGVELDNYVLESGSNTTVTYSSQDPSNIVKDALDKFTAAGGRVDYSGSSVETTATTVTYTFRLNTYLEVLKKAIELAPYDWFWWVGLGDDLVYYQDRPTTASHTFILGKHVEELNLEYSIENITNVVYFTGGEVSADTNLFKKYTDATSITNYRQGLQRITDHRVTLSASADLISEAEIERNATPRYRSSITILDKVYDIESIQLGQLIAFRNFGNYIDSLNLQIVGMRYEPDRVTLQLDTLLPSVNKRVADLRRNLLELDNEQTPSAPS